MSTRCNIHFKNSYTDVNIYRHSDGYPDGKSGVISDLHTFFNEVRRQCKGSIYGTRFDDPSYLAAKFIVWQAGENGEYAQDYSLTTAQQEASAKANPLNFGSLGVADKDASDGEYVYVVDCDTMDADKFPTVTFR